MSSRGHRSSAQFESLAKALRAIELDAAHPTSTKLVCYFDAAQVIEMVLGKYDMVDRDDADVPYDVKPKRTLPSFNLSLLRGLPATGIPCIAAAELLGEIRMLPPHQAEFQFQRRSNFDYDLLNPQLHSGTLALRLLDSIGKKDIKLKADIIDEGNEDDQILTAVNTHASMRRFMLYKLIQGHPYSLEDYISRGIVVLTDYDKEVFYEAMGSNYFQPLMDGLDHIRPRQRPQNTADALAILNLRERVQNFKLGLSVHSPRFYLPRNRFNTDFLRLLKDIGLWDDLCYKISDINGSSIPIFGDGIAESDRVETIQSWPYFFFHAVVGRTLTVASSGSYSPGEDFGLPPKSEWATDFRYTFVRLIDSKWNGLYSPGRSFARSSKTISDTIDAMFNKTVVEPLEAIERARTIDLLQKHRKLQATLDEVTKLNQNEKERERNFTWEALVRSTSIWWVFAGIRAKIKVQHAPVNETRDWIWRSLRVNHLALDTKVKSLAMRWLETILNVTDATTPEIRSETWKAIMSYMEQSDFAKTGQKEEGFLAVVAILIAGREREFYIPARRILRNQLSDTSSISSMLMNWHCRIYLRDIHTVKEFVDGMSALELKVRTNATTEARLGLAWASAVTANRMSDLFDVRGQAIDTRGIIRVYSQRSLDLAASITHSSDSSEEHRVFARNLVLHVLIHSSNHLRRAQRKKLAEEAASSLIAEKDSIGWLPVCSATLLQHCVFSLRGLPSTPENKRIAKLSFKIYDPFYAKMDSWPDDVDLAKIRKEYLVCRGQWGVRSKPSADRKRN